jgi:O-antigen biosynthesis protein WbqP
VTTRPDMQSNDAASLEAAASRPASPARWYLPVKRACDVTAAALGLILCGPFMVAVALAIKLDSPGPVIYRQRRVGLRGAHFVLLKFRTMHVGTPEVASEEMAEEDRLRYTTRVGRVLRKWTLDELPQLFNVLAGEMSLVGPRPALHNQHELIAMRRAAGVDRVRPGMTGLAIVKGGFTLSLEEKVAYDGAYVRRMSLDLDLRCIIKSLRRVTKAGVKGYRR